MAITVMAEDEGEEQINRWGWSEKSKHQRCCTVCDEAGAVLDEYAEELGITGSQVDAEALHFVAMLIERFGREGETLVGLLRRTRQAMEERDG